MTINAEFIASLETEMQVISEAEYGAAAAKVWWPLVAKRRTTRSRLAVLAWLLSTAKLYAEETGGSLRFEELAERFTEIEPAFSSAGLRMHRYELEDAASRGGELGEGADRALSWAEQMGGAFAYWPQRLAGIVLRTGHLAADAGGVDAYDGEPLFSAAHPLDPFDAKVGTYANLISGAPIDASVSLDVALANLADVFEHIGAIKLPQRGEGADFRCLRPKALIVPPKMYPRAKQLCAAMAGPVSIRLKAATFIEYAEAMSAIGNPVAAQAGELSGFENETTYFVVVEQVEASALGALVYVEREPFSISYYGPESSAKLARTNEVEWHARGRNKMAAGHPYLLFKVTAGS